MEDHLRKPWCLQTVLNRNEDHMPIWNTATKSTGAANWQNFDIHQGGVLCIGFNIHRDMPELLGHTLFQVTETENQYRWRCDI